MSRCGTVCAAMAYTDRQFGQVLDALDRSGQADHTLVIATTDHGIAFPFMKCHLTDHGTGVFLVLRGPGGWEGGLVRDDMVSQIDLLPTIFQLIGEPVPEHVQGRALAANVEEPHRDAVFASVNVHTVVQPMRSVRTDRWKYLRCWPINFPFTVLPNIDDSPTKALLYANGLRERVLPGRALYDLLFDPNETHNLVEDGAYHGVRQSLEQRLHTWMTETKDPLLSGSLSLPEDVVLTSPDHYHPPGEDGSHPDGLEYLKID
ncbi:MAG: sulfatase/phosphatase domain-containing protein [Opitutales bacterium]